MISDTYYLSSAHRSVSFFAFSDATAKRSKQNLRIKTIKGVIVEFCGPNGETAAEIRMARWYGCDVVGSHIIKETVLARYCGMRTISINLITNYASGYSESKVKYEDIHYNMDVSSDYFCDYLADVINVL